MLLNFYKMHSLGNDFVVIDLVTQNIRLHSSHIKRMANRHLGIGCDQILIIEPPIRPDANFFIKIFNQNGTEAEHCGNGVRCAAKLFYDLGLTDKKQITADCLAGRLEFEIKKNGNVSVNMGMPKFGYKEVNSKDLDTKNKIYKVNLVNFGNPHGVIFSENISDLNVKFYGKQLSEHKFFSNGSNIEFVEKISDSEIRIRVYERGVGETFACGSGACASVAIGEKLGKFKSTVKVHFKYGFLTVEKRDSNFILTGPTNSVYTGQCRF